MYQFSSCMAEYRSTGTHQKRTCQGDPQIAPQAAEASREASLRTACRSAPKRTRRERSPDRSAENGLTDSSRGIWGYLPTSFQFQLPTFCKQFTSPFLIEAFLQNGLICACMPCIRMNTIKFGFISETRPAEMQGV